MTQILSIKSTKPEKTVNLTSGAIDKVRELILAEGDPGLALRVWRCVPVDAVVSPMRCSSTLRSTQTDLVEEFDDVRVVVDPTKCRDGRRVHTRLQRRAHGCRLCDRQSQHHTQLWVWEFFLLADPSLGRLGQTRQLT